MNFSLAKGVDTDEGNSKSSGLKVFICAMVLITVSGGTFLITKHTNKPTATAYAGNVVLRHDACKLFTLDDAKKLLGIDAVASPNNASAVSPKASVSTCSYSANTKDVKNLKALTLLIRSSNPVQAQQAFELAKASNAQTLPNLGKAAYYNPDQSQLNILENETWIIIASTTGTTGKGSLTTPKNAATVILPRLQST